MMTIDSKWLSSHPLPQPDDGTDKDGRGLVLIVGGSAQTPGAILLASRAALRAGAGKLRLATVPEVAQGVALQIPECRCLDILSEAGLDELEERAQECAAVVLGPGMLDEKLAKNALRRLLNAPGVLVIDALPLLVTPVESLRERRGPTILTPNLDEMSEMLDRSTQGGSASPSQADEIVKRSGAVVALKGGETVIRAPDGRAVEVQGNVGLATSGAGDVLAGIIGGLAARGADPFEATAWGVHLHARAADRLAEKIGPLGFLASELAAEIPSLMRQYGETGANR